MNILDLKPDFKDDPELFINLGKVDGFVEYLRKTADADIRRYFIAPDDKQRENLRGSQTRTMYLVSKIIEHRKK